MKDEGFFGWSYLEINLKVTFWAECYYSRMGFVFVLQIRILCGVEHDDLKRLFFVSKSLREAVSFYISL